MTASVWMEDIREWVGVKVSDGPNDLLSFGFDVWFDWRQQ